MWTLPAVPAVRVRRIQPYRNATFAEIGSTTPTANCEEPSGGFASPFGYEGLFAAHEQVNLSGSSNFAGLVIAEEAAYCVEPQPQERRLE